MFGNWFGDFGATKAHKAAAKKRALAKKLPRTGKPSKRTYPKHAAAAFGPAAYIPSGIPGTDYDDYEEEGGFFYPGPMSVSPMGPAMGPAGTTVTIGEPKSEFSRQVCGCKVVVVGKGKNKREALKCEGAGPKGGPQYRFTNARDIARAKAADTVCTFLPNLSMRRPLSPEERAARRAAKAYSFVTSRGQRIDLKRRPSARILRKHVALYFNDLSQKMKKRGAKLRYAPAFADINDWGW